MRPTFHFTAERGWINDPLGITFRHGRYEIFYQQVPDSVTWRLDCSWGHARSPDLFSFEQVAVAISPGSGDDGIWTGCLIEHDGRATAFYTAVSAADPAIGRVRSAVPVDDDWTEWAKGDVVVEAPRGMDVVVFRDPYVFRDGDGSWRMIVGAGLRDGTAAAVSYLSTDLQTWDFDGLLAERSSAERDPIWTGTLWECPQVFDVDGRQVLIVSVWDADVGHYVAAAVGSLVDGQFTADSWQRLTYGDCYYAPSYFRDAADRACVILWLRGIADLDAGWAGAQSVPHVLALVDGRLTAEPHPGLEDHRRPPSSPQRVSSLAADVTWNGSRLEVESSDKTIASITIADEMLIVEASGMSQRMPYGGGQIRTILDGPILEVSTRDGILAVAVDPSGPGFEFSTDGEIALFAVDVVAGRVGSESVTSS